jgi:hypothetical protein
MNTQTKKSANGSTYQVSTSFKIGNKVAVHNKITGEISYTGFIKYYSNKGKHTGHIATIVTDKGNIQNTLGSALVIN